MRGADVMLHALELVHGFYRDMRADPALLAARDFRAAPLANSLAWNWWHTARTEDFMVNRICRDAAELWTPALVAATGLPHGIGTGQPAHEAARLRIADLDAFFAYQEAVFAAGEAFVASLDDPALDHSVRIGDRTETIAENLTLHVLVHLSAHLGETDLTRELYEHDRTPGAPRS